MSRLIPKKQKGNLIWTQPANTYFPQGEQTYYGGILPDVDITAKPMSKARKAVRKALNMPIMVPATTPNPSSVASWQYNPNNLVQTTLKQELDYLAGLAVPVAPYLTSGYFLGTGIKDMIENGVSAGNSVQVGLSALPFAKPVSKYASAVVDKGLTALGNKNAGIRNIGKEAEIWDNAYFNALEGENLNEAQRLRDLHFVTKAPKTKTIDYAGNPVRLYHGSPDAFNYFEGVNWADDAIKNGRTVSINEIEAAKSKVARNYFTPNKEIANKYAGKNGKVYEIYLNTENPLTYSEEAIRNMTGKDYISDWSRFGGDDRRIVMNKDYDALYIPQYSDSYLPLKSGAQIKSAAAVTYDDAGNIIPLSQRDNPLNPDIRYGLIPILGSNILGVSKKQQGGTLAQQRAAENQRHSTLAKHYVQHPTLPNLAKAGYHWFKSKPGLGGQFENDNVLITGTAPLPDVPLSVIKKAEAIATATKFVGPSANVTKTIKNAEALEKGAQGTVKRLTKKNLTSNLEIQNLRQYEAFETPFNKIARKLYMTDDPTKSSNYLRQIENLITRFKNGL